LCLWDRSLIEVGCTVDRCAAAVVRDRRRLHAMVKETPQGSELPDYLLAIDQGTTSTRAILFDAALTPIASAQQEFAQLYPAPGLVEHNPEEIWSTTLATVRTAIARAGVEARQIGALGIANQRETTIVWERATGRPIHNAIVWQDRRTADACAALQARG